MPQYTPLPVICGCITIPLPQKKLSSLKQFMSIPHGSVGQPGSGGQSSHAVSPVDRGGRGRSHRKAQPGCTPASQALLAVDAGLRQRAQRGRQPEPFRVGSPWGWLHLARQLDSTRALAKNKCSKRPSLKPQGSWRPRLGSQAASPPLLLVQHKSQSQPKFKESGLHKGVSTGRHGSFGGHL